MERSKVGLRPQRAYHRHHHPIHGPGRYLQSTRPHAAWESSVGPTVYLMLLTITTAALSLDGSSILIMRTILPLTLTRLSLISSPTIAPRCVLGLLVLIPIKFPF